ncbi:MAG: TonB family protein [Proteobacteria bacterium]|nr:TonB family protein [Pseudomonadota bacterium]
MIAEVLRILVLSTLAASAAIVVVLLLRKPLRVRFGAQAAYALWTLVPLAAVVALLPAPVASVALPMTVVATKPAAITTLQHAAAGVTGFDPIPWLGAVWLLGMVVCAALFLRQQRRYLRTLGGLSLNADRTFRAQTTAGCPALVGAWRPRIVLPTDFEQRYDRTQRELILAHERAHLARGDAQLNAFAAVLRCLHWFNPLFHIAASRFRFDQELACDASVIARFPQARRSYADAMLKTQLADLGLPAGCHWQSSHPLKERIAMLKKPLPGRTRRWLGGACVAAIVATMSFAVWAAQPAKESASRPVDVKSSAAVELVLSVEGAPTDAELLRSETKSVLVPASDVAHPAKLADMHFGLAMADPFSLEIGRGGQVWQIDGSAHETLGQGYQIDTTLTLDGKVVGHPSVKMREGEPAAIKVGSGKNANTEGFAAQFTFRDAKSPIADGKQIQVASGKTPRDAGSSPRITDVSYRRVTRIAYPQSAIVAKAQGVVYIKMRVGADGKVVSAKVNSVMPMARTDLADAALAAVKTWTFEPRKVDGTAVASDTTVAIAFSLDPARPLAVEPEGALDAIRVSPPQGEL